MLSKQQQIRIRNINNVVIQISWTVSTWEKPAGFVSNKKRHRDKNSGELAETGSKASESDSEDSENEAQSSETNFKVSSLFRFILHTLIIV